MKTQDLRTGDVLVYQRSTRGPIFARLIRLCTGSEYTHAGIFIGQGKLGGVLEQLYVREFCFISKYKKEKNEIVTVWRPRFELPVIPYSEVCDNRTYGVLNILDSLLQHGLSYMHSYVKHPILSKWSSNLTCSALVAKILQLDKNCSWLADYRLCEPQLIPAHPETFEPLGVLELEVK